jgi:hypothetical protein
LSVVRSQLLVGAGRGNDGGEHWLVDRVQMWRLVEGVERAGIG